MSARRALISDFGGVLTTPLLEAFAAYQDGTGLDWEALGRAMARLTEEDGANPLFELECGRLAVADFMARLEAALSADLGRPVRLHDFTEAYFGNLQPNEELIAYLRQLRGRGLRLALLTNNVREWEPLWRPMLPVDELFEVVVDSAFVGMRKPDPAIYELTLERLGLAARECVFVDDADVNCQTAERLGIAAVHFRSTPQAIGEIEAALADPGG